MPVVANILQPLTDVEEWVLETLHGIGLTWGLAIVGLTLLTRTITIPLVVRQFRSQRDMKLHMPEMKRIQKEHKDDKQRLQQEMSAYYREHGINSVPAMVLNGRQLVSGSQSVSYYEQMLREMSAAAA